MQLIDGWECRRDQFGTLYQKRRCTPIQIVLPSNRFGQHFELPPGCAESSQSIFMLQISRTGKFLIGENTILPIRHNGCGCE